MAKDLVEAVGATWTGHALDHIPGKYQGMVSVTTPRGPQNMTTLAEAGMNMYLFRSDKFELRVRRNGDDHYRVSWRRWRVAPKYSVGSWGPVLGVGLE